LRNIRVLFIRQDTPRTGYRSDYRPSSRDSDGKEFSCSARTLSRVIHRQRRSSGARANRSAKLNRIRRTRAGNRVVRCIAMRTTLSSSLPPSPSRSPSSFSGRERGKTRRRNRAVAPRRGFTTEGGSNVAYFLPHASGDENRAAQFHSRRLADTSAMNAFFRTRARARARAELFGVALRPRRSGPKRAERRN